jgi:hypothetical protein
VTISPGADAYLLFCTRAALKIHYFARERFAVAVFEKHRSLHRIARISRLIAGRVNDSADAIGKSCALYDSRRFVIEYRRDDKTCTRL